MKEFKVLMRFIKPYRGWVIFATFCMVCVTAMSMAGPWAVRNLISTITESVADDSERFRQVTTLALIVIGIYVLRAFSGFGTNYVAHYAAWKILEEVRQFMYEHIQKLSLRYFHNNQTGDLMSRVINDTRNFEQLLAHAIPTIIVNGLMFVGVSAILFSMSPILALYTMIPVPLLAWMVLKFSKVSRPLFRKAQDRVADMNATLQDHFSGIKEIKSFTREEAASMQTYKHNNAYTVAILKALKLSNAFHPSIEFVAGLGTVIVIFFGGRLSLQGSLPLADIVAFLLYLELFYRPITALGHINEGLQQALGSAERVIEVLHENPEVEERKNPIHIERAKGTVAFEDVSFRYVESIPVIDHISFEVKSGETLALVGATGVGKTTIASLLPRFYDPNEGVIRLDGIDIRKISLSSLRSQISLVSQDVFLFNGTVKENILYGRKDADEDEVVQAAKMANAHDFIMALENGYETKVGERGVKLSGGQKQRISIARAVLKDAPVLILDEATSSVDTTTEQLIQEALYTLKKDKTSIVIAHRLSTISQADCILVLQDGAIVESGKHEELLKKDGLYASLCNAQSSIGKLAV